jgi:2-iminobutanoate/2-iminopropanoate deaminase
MAAMSKPIGPYTPLVRAGDLMFLSGQVGLSEGQMVPGGVEAETRQALANIRSLLESEGASLGDVVKTTVFLRHMRDYSIMNEAYTDVFGDHRPARSCVAVVELPAVALVEVEAVAHAPSK